MRLRSLAIVLTVVALSAIGWLVDAHRPPQHKNVFINPSGGTIQDRFIPPPGYTRMPLPQYSFAGYLRNLKLKPHGSPVHYFNGSIKNKDVYVAVVDMPIGDRDLQQCADVIMHVRAEYLYQNAMEDKIAFTMTNGFKAEYSKWKQGYRIKVTGNKTAWAKTAQPGNDRASFNQYMDLIYTYCGTLSLSKELKDIEYTDIVPGDVLIKGGSPGHAELVMDVAVNKKGEKMYLLAQSYMPAQEMQVLKNPEDPDLSPWYKLSTSAGEIITPEWTFTIGQAMRFPEQ